MTNPIETIRVALTRHQFEVLRIGIAISSRMVSKADGRIRRAAEENVTRSRSNIVGILIGVSAVMTAGVAAQQPAAQVPLGILRVPACQPASDPEYGRVAAKAIAIGGGPAYMVARQRNYLNALRGPQGQVLRIGNGVGSSPLPGDPERAIVDSFVVTYDGDTGPVSTTLYMDAYHYSAPKAPAGSTCGAPLATAAPIPPADPFKITPALVSLAIEQGSKADLTPIRLDTSTPRGYFFDRFVLIALQARAAA